MGECPYMGTYAVTPAGSTRPCFAGKAGQVEALFRCCEVCDRSAVVLCPCQGFSLAQKGGTSNARHGNEPERATVMAGLVAGVLVLADTRGSRPAPVPLTS